MAEAIVEIGPYRIERELGRGGMGVVYLGVDVRLDREVAIKLLPAEIAQDSVSRERFTNEARSAARLQHPNILPIYDVGEYEGRPYLVMQCVHGGDLATWLEPARHLAPTEAGHLLHAIAAGIDTAHAYGVIHRDIKPENVLLGDNGQAMLTDFGIARITDGRSRGLTQTGMIMGTPEYMSPEQAMGNPVDHRSDLYSFGAVTYRILTGQPPFGGDTAVTIALKHVQEPMPDPRGLVPELSPGTVNALGRMMAKSPDERYDTAKAFVDALLAGTETYQPSPRTLHEVPSPVAVAAPASAEAPPGQELGAAVATQAPSRLMLAAMLVTVLILSGATVLLNQLTRSPGGQRAMAAVWGTSTAEAGDDGASPGEGSGESRFRGGSNR